MFRDDDLIHVTLLILPNSLLTVAVFQKVCVRVPNRVPNGQRALFYFPIVLNVFPSATNRLVSPITSLLNTPPIIYILPLIAHVFRLQNPRMKGHPIGRLHNNDLLFPLFHYNCRGIVNFLLAISASLTRDHGTFYSRYGRNEGVGVFAKGTILSLRLVSQLWVITMPMDAMVFVFFRLSASWVSNT